MNEARAYNPDFEKLRILIKHGANVNTQNRYGYTLLHNAANSETSELAKFLIFEAKADINAKDGYDSTPLDIAKMMKNITMIQYLSEVLEKME
jgi:ankyrin repeat protein